MRLGPPLARKAPLVYAALCFAAAISTAQAASISMVAYLSGASVVPPNRSAAFGEADFTYDSASGELNYFISYEGLPSAQVEIHGPSSTTENAPVVIPFPMPQSPVSGILVLNSRQADTLLAGELYVEVHGRGRAEDAIRGQIEKRQIEK
ncbi:MAG TPA: CHRD domain-containing protein [Rhizomicrobium sp.]|nr:CHRD domain-containing protein [Rhizomicrobium sp.]